MDIQNLPTRISLSPEGLSELQHLYDKAVQVGPSTAAYLLKLVALGYMEQRIVGGARALLSLLKAYDSIRVDEACKRGLMDSKCNFEIIKNILLNNMDRLPVQRTPAGTTQPSETISYLRGSASFNL